MMKAKGLSLENINHPSSPQEEKQEASKHRRALVQGRGLIGLGFALLALFGLITAAVLVHLTTFSFPSGHVTQYVLFFGFSFYLAYTLLKPGPLRTALLVFTGGMVLLVGPSRVWMGQHWASDVLGGYTLGFGLLLLVIWAYRVWEARFVRQG